MGNGRFDSIDSREMASENLQYAHYDLGSVVEHIRAAGDRDHAAPKEWVDKKVGEVKKLQNEITNWRDSLDG